MRIEVSNTDAKEIDQLSLRLMELKFPQRSERGHAGGGHVRLRVKGPEWPLHQFPPSIPSVADPQFVVPIVRADYGTGALNFCSDDLECPVDMPYSTNLLARNSYPFVITCSDIKAGY